MPFWTLCWGTPNTMKKWFLMETVPLPSETLGFATIDVPWGVPRHSQKNTKFNKEATTDQLR